VARTISDAQVAGILRSVVGGSGPVLRAIAEQGQGGLLSLVDGDRSGPIGRLLDRMTAMPGGPAFQAMRVEDRADWWVERLGRATALLIAAPGFAGVMGGAGDVQDLLGAANQALVLCAIGREHGLDEPQQVRLVASVVLQRELDADVVRGAAPIDGDGLLGQLDAQDGADAEGKAPTSLLGRLRALRRMGQTMRALQGEIGKRPQGRLHHRMLGKVPVVAVVGDYAGERSALKRAAGAGREWIEREQRVGMTVAPPGG
jgi:hypothetical protein